MIGLWLQLVLSIGHVHPTEVFGPIGHFISVDSGPDRVSARPDDDSGGPADRQAGDIDIDGCALCASLHLTASATPPVLAAPIPAASGTRPAPPIVPDSATGRSPYSHAPPRAPPIP